MSASTIIPASFQPSPGPHGIPVAPPAAPVQPPIYRYHGEFRFKDGTSAPIDIEAFNISAALFAILGVLMQAPQPPEVKSLTLNVSLKSNLVLPR